VKATVFGATGGVGREVIAQALDRGDHVTAYVRNPAKLDLAHPNLTVITGELTDREAVRRTVRGADAVVSARPVAGPQGDRDAARRRHPRHCRSDASRSRRALHRYGHPQPARPARRPQPARPHRPLHGPHVLAARLPRAAGHVATRHRQPLDWTIARFTRPTDGTGTVRAGYLGRDGIRASITRADIATVLRPEHRPPLPPLRAGHQQLSDRLLSCHRTSENSVHAKFAELPFQAVG
jgi:NAD(P)H-binding